MSAMRTTIDALKQAGLRGQVKIMVGGAPVTRQFADDIGADGYSDNASTAVALARTLTGAGRS
jgi:methanogenic corrinoid protein MtbC1